MAVELVYHCDAPECPVTRTVSLDGSDALNTPAGWTTLGAWDDYYHACSTAHAALVAEIRGVRPVERNRRRGA